MALSEILKEWDGADLMAGVAMAARARHVRSLAEFLTLTTEVERFARVQRLHQVRDRKR